MGVSTTPKRKIVFSAANVVTCSYTSSSSTNVWSQLIASTSTSIYVTALIFARNPGNAVVDLGTGAAGSETVLASTKGYLDNTVFLALPYPLRIPASTRVAMRNNGGNMVMGFQYVTEGSVV